MEHDVTISAEQYSYVRDTVDKKLSYAVVSTTADTAVVFSHGTKRGIHINGRIGNYTDLYLDMERHGFHFKEVRVAACFCGYHRSVSINGCTIRPLFDRALDEIRCVWIKSGSSMVKGHIYY